jgi:hypothetical protein
VKAKADPLTGSHPLTQRCSAKSKQRQAQCKQPAIAGGTVCRYHGGAAPQVKKAAEQRLQELKQPAIAYLAHLLEQKQFPSAGLGAAKDVLDRIDGKPRESVDMNHSGDVTVRWADE